MAQASFEPGTSRSRVLRSAGTSHWLGLSNTVLQKNHCPGKKAFVRSRLARGESFRPNSYVRSQTIIVSVIGSRLDRPVRPASQ